MRIGKTVVGWVEMGKVNLLDDAAISAAWEDNSGWALQPLILWLANEGRLIRNPAKLIEALCRRLQQAGAPIYRLRCNFNTLHPEVAGRKFTWWRDRPVVEEYCALHAVMDTPIYIGSPIETIQVRGESVRFRLDGKDLSQLHSSLQGAASEGVVDYLGFPMVFNDGNVNAFLVGTDRELGFSDGDVAKFKLLVDFFAPVFEAIALRFLAHSLLDTYIGPRSGKKVLKGHIQRGDNEQIDAVVWFSDLRDFTALSVQLSNDELLRLLNCYFETVAAAVTRNGGEVLRFIGDAMLVLFPCGTQPTPETACRQAVKAAEQALAAVQSLNRERQAIGRPLIRFGIGLDQGRVIYGNVGAPNRLDFTVMGATVNRAARLESLTKTLEVPLLMSEEVARWIDSIAKPMGQIPLKGMSEPQSVYSLAGKPSAQP